MSKDIRSFFTPLGGAKKKSDSSTATIQPPKKRPAMVIVSDSDDEDIIPSSSKKKIKTSNGGSSSKVAKKSSPAPSKKPTSELKVVNAMDIFGSKKISRSTETTAKAKKVEVHKDLGLKATFEDAFEDVDFEATCKQLDAAAADAMAIARHESEEANKGNKKEIPLESKSKSMDKEQEIYSHNNGDNGNVKEEEKRLQKKKKKHEEEYETVNEELNRVEKSSKMKVDKEEKRDKKNRESSGSSNNVSVEKADKQDKKKKDTAQDNDATSVVKVDKQDKKKKDTAGDTDMARVDKADKQDKKKKDTAQDNDVTSAGKADKQDKKKKDTAQDNVTSLDKVDKQDKKKDTAGDNDKASPRVDKAEKRDKKEAKKKVDDDDEDDEHSWMKDPAERRRISAIGYQRYLQREGPKNLGLKEIPKGRPDCLKGLVFVVTGVLDSLERDAAATLIQECGGKVTQSLSRNTSYIVVGEEAGPAKVNKAEQLGTPQLDEDGLLNLIRRKSGIPVSEAGSSQDATQSSPSTRKDKVSKESAREGRSVKEETKKKSVKSEELKTAETSPRKERDRIPKEETGKVQNDIKKQYTSPFFAKEDKSVKVEELKKVPVSPRQAVGNTSAAKTATSDSVDPVLHSQLWVDKYKPTNTKQIIGQQGDSSNLKKLTKWLENWQRNQFGGKVLKRPDMYARNDDGAFFKAALLSGSPGVGKTTTAHLVCKELGFDMVEFNASDTRSKKLLHEQVSELLSSKSLYDFFRGGEGVTSKHVLVMDEVDGMAGNEDRGGVAELIQLIKNSKVPIICMCNDPNHPKMRSLIGHCFHLRFVKPKVEQIRGALMSICFKEGLKMSPTQLSEMIVASSQDVRQVIHHLSMCSADQEPAGSSQPVGSSQPSSQGQPVKQLKNIRLGPFDVVKKVFSADDHKTMSINDKSDLFFFDYSLSPLFVQQNYLHVTPHAAKNNRRKHLDLLAEAADSMCWGDVVDKSVRRNNAWSLLPTQGMFASVIPGDVMEGHLSAMIDFPAWLGKNSQRNKQQRLMTELHTHSQLKTSCDKLSLGLDYLPFLRDAVTRPLIAHGLDGVPAALDVLLAYNLLRTDIDSIMEVSVWKKTVDPWARVESKVKAALTRAYKSAKPNLPYSTDEGFSKKKAGSGGMGMDLDNPERDGEEEEEESDDDVTTDSRIKVKPASSAKTAEPKGKKGGSTAVKRVNSGSSSGSSPGCAPAKKGRGRGKSK